MLSHYVNFTVHRYGKNGVETAEQPVSCEYPLLLKINGSRYLSIASSGENFEDLAVGYLISEGIVTSIGQIEKVTIDTESMTADVTIPITPETIDRLFRLRYLASGCGQGSDERGKGLPPVVSTTTIEAQVIVASMKNFLGETSMHALTRGVHSASLYSFTGKKIVFFDEIGRHNAIDKIIGHCYRNNISMADTMILSTGRLSSEIIFKAIHGRAPLVVSRAMPTSRSVEAARENNVMLVCGLTGTGFTVFHGADRIIPENNSGQHGAEKS